jgi:oxygen-independent coproporphyrinogen-3 oxidase
MPRSASTISPVPEDGLAVAQAGKLRRNFQGYTDDTGEVLIGVGASAISRFPQGFAQNAPATGAHVAAIREGRFSVSRGPRFQGRRPSALADDRDGDV